MRNISKNQLEKKNIDLQHKFYAKAKENLAKAYLLSGI